MISAVIFDMDGLLIDSEPVWREAEVLAFQEVGVSLTHEQCKETLGLGIPEAIAYWYRRFPWQGPGITAVANRMVALFLEQFTAHGQLMAGARETVEAFAHKGYPIGVASSSPLHVIEAVLETTGLKPFFQAISSGEAEEYSKPHPAVYLTTCKKLGVPPFETLTFEDSFQGLLAAKSARTKAVCIPDPDHWHDTRFDIADLKLPSLQAFTWEQLEQLAKR
jgi:sugar-phosphatase